MSPGAPSRDDRILVFAPNGRDVELAVGMLTEAGLRADVCADIETLARELNLGAGVALLAEEALVPPDVWTLVDAVRQQPPWADVPLLVLTTASDAPAANPSALRLVEEMGNVTVLERPVRVITLLSAIRAALRARRRQYEVRDHLEERRRALIEREDLLARERVARADVEAANRAKDEFLAVLSHELRTPLQPILGWVKLLRRGMDDDTLRRGLETIERNAQAQAQIVEDLLDISRVIAGKLNLDQRRMALQPVVEAAVDAVRGMAEAKAIGIETRGLDAHLIVFGDSNRLQQIVWNLLANAVAFTPDGGHVTVSVERQNESAAVRVIDTGAGIAPEILPHIFDRFRQADSTSTRRHGGLGLGLAIVRHLVELHGGQVRAVSAGEGHGSTFTVTLPLASEAGDVETPAAVTDGSALDGLVLTGVDVVVVDDDPDTCELLATVLGYYGAEVRATKSAEEALREIEARTPDVLVSDIAMPGIDGYELVRRLRTLCAERGWRIPSLALTAHARASDSEQAFLAGFQAYIPKPVEPAELAQAIANLATRSDPSPPPRAIGP